jgi:hypothetical protein
MIMLNIAIMEERLSDGSSVFNVFVGTLKLEAVDEKSADRLAQGIRDLIEANTNQDASVQAFAL